GGATADGAARDGTSRAAGGARAGGDARVPGGLRRARWGGRDAHAGDPALRVAPLSLCGDSEGPFATCPDGGGAELCAGRCLADADTAGENAGERLRPPVGHRVGRRIRQWYRDARAPSLRGRYGVSSCCRVLLTASALKPG